MRLPVLADGEEKPKVQCPLAPQARRTRPVLRRRAMPSSPGFADGWKHRSMVNGGVAGSRSGLPGAGASNWRSRISSLESDVAPAEDCARKVAEGGWRLDHAVENTAVPPARSASVVDAVAESQRGGDQVIILSPVLAARRCRRGRDDGRRCSLKPRCRARVAGRSRLGIGHQAVVIKDDADPVGIVLWQHLLSATLLSIAVFCSKTIIPDSEEHLFALSGGLSHALVRWIGAKEWRWGIEGV